MDPFVGSALIGGAGGLIGGLFGNSAANKQQETANNFNKEQAIWNREFQERMSNTAYRRAKDDMIGAGINPMLAYSQGGASSPSGAQSAAAQAAPVRAGVGKGISSALATSQFKREMKQQDSQLALNEELKNTQQTQQVANQASARAAGAQANKANYETRLLDVAFDKSKAELPAAKAESSLRAKQAGIDEKMINLDNTLSRVRQATGVVSDAVGVLKPKIQIGGGNTNEYQKLQRENATMKDYIKNR